MKVTIIKDGARIDNIDYSVGDVIDLPDALVAPWREAGLCIVGDPPPPNIAPPEPPKVAAAKKVAKE
jgi:hypothetical protein